MSISSAEGSPAPADLLSKYQRLASEYAKARSQIAVLKQAIRDEQVKSTLQKDELKAREQELRKDSQELESLAFRNEQLTKRVTFLQDELDKIQAAARKGRGVPENSLVFEESKLFQEELQKTIILNATLLSKLEENECLLEKERFQAKATIDHLRKSLQDAIRQPKTTQQISMGNFHPLPSGSWKEEFVGTLPVCEVINKTLAVVDAHKENSSALVHAYEIFSSHNYLPDELGEAVLACEAQTKSYSPAVSLLVDHLVQLLNQILAFLNGAEPDGMACIEQAANSFASVVTDVSDTCTSDGGTAISASLLNLRKFSLSFAKVAALLRKDKLSDNREDRPVACLRCPSAEVQFKEKIASLEERLAKNSIIDVPKTESSVNPNSSKNSNSSKTLEDLQNAESKFTRMQCEADSIRCRYEQTLDELNLKKLSISQLEEELSITTRNYEDQLGSMSEHMANMNDKLTAQQTMIEELTYELQSKDAKKSRGK